ncbi:MAG: hypothetical protein KIT60_12170 [Burkholderiaceae bacterium]|nr:hypothetical protein [Burkholderiaceae bacterium]
MVEWVRAGYRLRDRLQFRYRLVLYGPPILGLAALLPVFWLVMAFIANAIGLGHGPVRGHPMALWAFISLAVGGFLTITIGCFLGSLALALVLRYWAGWSWIDLRRLMVESQAPSHWLLSER